MLQVDRSVTSTRFRMLEALRDFGRRSPGAVARHRALARRHGEHYRHLCVEQSRRALGKGSQAGGGPLFVEWDNFRTAMDWALEAADLTMAIDFAVPIGQWALRALQSEHRLWVERCLVLAADETEDRASLLTLAARWSGLSGSHGESRRLALEAVRCGAPDSPSTAASEVTVAFSSGMLGLFAETVRAIQRAEAALEMCGDGFTYVEGRAVLHPLIVIGSPGRRDEHRDLVHRAARDLDNGIADAIVGRMDVVDHVRSGELDKATWLLPAAIECARQAQARSIEMDLRSMALGILSPDDPTVAERYLEVLTALKTYDYGETIWSVMELLGAVLGPAGSDRVRRHRARPSAGQPASVPESTRAGASRPAPRPGGVGPGCGGGTGRRSGDDQERARELRDRGPARAVTAAGLTRRAGATRAAVRRRPP